MKRIALYVLGLLLCATFLSVMPVEGEEGIYDSVVRLHILANSDSEEDQRLKLAVRDAVLEEYGEVLNCGDKTAAEERISELLPAVKKTAEETLATHGCPHTVKIYFTEEKYPTRTYGELDFPAGVYSSLRIIIGEGEGQNWWCVLFPPICLDAAVEAAATTPSKPNELDEAEWKLVSRDGRYEVRFRLLEMLAELAE